MKPLQISPTQIVPFSIHITANVVLLLLSLFVSSVVNGPSFIDDDFFERYVWAGFLLNCVYFYLCYFVFQRQSLRWWQTVILLVFIFVFFLVTTVSIDVFHVKQTLEQTGNNQFLMYFIFINSLVKSWYLLVAWFIYTVINLLIQRRYYNELKLATLESELSLLKNQTNPHFLFNSLNSLYASSYKFGDIRTAEAIAQMSSILRYMLHNNQLQSVSILDELENIENYIALQKFRYQDKLDVKFNHNITQDLFITPMLIMPLIENAFKYGVVTNELNEVEIKVEYRDNVLTFIVLNCDKSEQIKLHKNHLESGLGLDNLRKRLQLIYGYKHKLHCDTHNGIYSAKMELKL